MGDGDETVKTVTCVVIAEHVKNKVSLKKKRNKVAQPFYRPLQDYICLVLQGFYFGKERRCLKC